MIDKYLVCIFLFLGPILDVFSFYNNPLNIICRTLFLTGSIIYLLYKKKNNKYLIPLLIFSVVLFLFQYFYLNIPLVSICSNILKFLYLPISMLFFRDFLLPVDRNKILTIIVFTYLVIYYISYVTGIGVDAYVKAIGKSGFKGVFSSINEFSAIITCLIPIVFSYLKNNKKFILLLILFLMIIGSSLLIGTKVLFGGVLFGIFYLLFQERENLFFKRSKKQKIIIALIFIFLLIGGVYLFTKTRTYQNMIVQKNFFKVKNIISFEFVNKVIYNDRIGFMITNFKYFFKQDIFRQLLGIGMQEISVKMIEIDILDIIIRYGLIGFLVFMFINILIIKNNRIVNIDSLISLIILILISLTSGHVLLSPAVSIYFGLILNNSNNT